MSDITARKAELHAKLDKFLSRRVGNGYDWPKVTEGQLSDFRDIIDEIAELKFIKDCDGDQVIQYAISSRKDGRLVADVVPHVPHRGDFRTDRAYDTAFQKYLAAGTRQAHYLIGEGQEILRLVTTFMDRKYR